MRKRGRVAETCSLIAADVGCYRLMDVLQQLYSAKFAKMSWKKVSLSHWNLIGEDMRSLSVVDTVSLSVSVSGHLSMFT